jgi:nucleotide-binding universal stress UspA family protein
MFRINEIVCPTDFSKESLRALSAASDFASQFEAEVLLVNVLNVQPALVSDSNYAFVVPEYEQQLRSEADHQLRELGRELESRDIRTRTLVAHGDPANEIVRIADQERADLIIIATFGKTGWRRLAFGSVTEKVVRLASCPVLTVRGIVAPVVRNASTVETAA